MVAITLEFAYNGIRSREWFTAEVPAFNSVSSVVAVVHSA
jgi:hypothetical protein